MSAIAVTPPHRERASTPDVVIVPFVASAPPRVGLPCVEGALPSKCRDHSME